MGVADNVVFHSQCSIPIEPFVNPRSSPLQASFSYLLSFQAPTEWPISAVSPMILGILEYRRGGPEDSGSQPTERSGMQCRAGAHASIVCTWQAVSFILCDKEDSKRLKMFDLSNYHPNLNPSLYGNITFLVDLPRYRQLYCRWIVINWHDGFRRPEGHQPSILQHCCVHWNRTVWHCVGCST